jgi:hypothetical protein
MDKVRAVPEPVRTVVHKAPATQAGVPWPRQSWLKRFPQFADRFATLPERVDRASIRHAALAATTDPQGAQWGFVAVMVWGYGVTGYGPWRVEQMFASIDEPGQRLLEVARTLIDEGAGAAYSLLAGAARMRKLGPAFGTKFLYFCPQPDEPPRALILDRLVAAWLRTHSDVRVNPVLWSVRRYLRYLDVMHAWAQTIGVAPDEIERAIFQAQANVGGGQWSSTARE